MASRYSLDDYVAIDVGQARGEWRAILARPQAAPTKRGPTFTPIETVLCLAAYVRVDHRRFGGRTSHSAPTPVPELGSLFRRSPSSILAKMANLDGSRSNGGRWDRPAAAQLLADGAEALWAAYRTILDAGREVDVTPAMLPDFLRIEDGPPVGFMRTEISDSALVREHEERIARLGVLDDLDRLVTERLLVGIARIGQERFARNVLDNYRFTCGFCGLTIPPGLRGRGLLRASHIKPWRVSTDAERIDVANGIAACPTHDAAFDAGLLYVGSALEVHAADDLSRAFANQPSLRLAFGPQALLSALALPPAAIQPGPTFVDWHRDMVASSGRASPVDSVRVGGG